MSYLKKNVMVNKNAKDLDTFNDFDFRSKIHQNK